MDRRAEHRYAGIIAGGTGTRLWPASRVARPKQLLPIAGGMSLLAHAWHRVDGVIAPARRLVCTTDAFSSAMQGTIDGLGPGNLVLEPCGRDTLNAVGLLAFTLARRDPDAVLAVLTADHLIEPANLFRERLADAFALVEADAARLATFGITPTYAATGYGYIERGAAIEGFSRAFRATRFVEKPDRMRAEEYLRTGNFAWNSGMFVFRAETMCAAIRAFAPTNADGLARIAAGAAIGEVYPTLPRNSIDRGVMEHAAASAQFSVCMSALDVQWLDVGSWPSYAETIEADASGNRSNAHWCDVDSRGLLVVSEDPSHLIATVGCEDLVIVHTKDATLICPRAQAERVKELVERIPEKWR